MAGLLSRVVSLLGIPQQFTGASALTAQSSLTADGTLIPGYTTWQGASALTAQSSLTGSGLLVQVASAALTSQSSLSVSATQVRPAASVLDGSSTLTAGAIWVASAAASLSSQNNLTANATRVILGSDIIVGTSDLVAAATRVSLGATDLTVQSSLTANGGLIVNAGTASLSSNTNLSPYAVRVQIGDTVMTGTLSMTGSMLPINRFIDPHYEQTYTDNILMGRYGIDTGKTVIVKDGVVTITDYPYQDELEAADFYLLGGHHYQLTDEQAQTLIDAGHGELVEIA